MIIDAKDKIIGRVASYAAKKALLGEKVYVVNCNYALFSGRKEWVIEDYKKKIDKGTYKKGPFYFRQPYKLVKRIIRGMLPHKKTKGKEALKRIRCYDNIPKELEGKEYEKIKKGGVSKLKRANYIYIWELCKRLNEK